MTAWYLLSIGRYLLLATCDLYNYLQSESFWSLLFLAKKLLPFTPVVRLPLVFLHLHGLSEWKILNTPFQCCQKCFLFCFFDGKVLASAWHRINVRQKSPWTKVSFDNCALGQWTSVLWPNAEGVGKNLSPSRTGNDIGGIFCQFDLSLKPRPQSGMCSEVR